MWIEKAKNGYHYYEKYKDPITDKWRRVCVTRESKSKADQRAAQRLLSAKIAEATKKHDYTNVTFSELREAFLSDYKSEVREQTYRGVKSKLNVMEGYLGADTRVKSITAPYFRQMLADCVPTDYNEKLRVFCQLMKWAYANDYVSDIQWLSKLQRMKTTPQRVKNSDKYLEHDEIEKLIANMPSPRWKLLTEFLILSGLRVGEAIALKDSDITDVIKVDKTWSVPLKKESYTKTETSDREVFVQDELADCISRIRKWRLMDMMANGYRTDFFFANNKGDHVDYASYSRIMKEVSTKVLGRPVKVHALRHTHVAMLAEAGMSLEEIAARVGHRGSKITREVYYHVTDKMRDRANEKLKKVKII